MSSEHDAMENQLRDALTRAADRAPRGPQPQAILHRLALRQQRRRWAGGAATAAAVLLVATVTWLNMTSQRSGSPGPLPVASLPSPEPKKNVSTSLVTANPRAQASLTALLDTFSRSTAAEMDWSTSLNLRLSQAGEESDWTFYNLRLALSDGG